MLLRPPFAAPDLRAAAARGLVGAAAFVALALVELVRDFGFAAELFLAFAGADFFAALRVEAAAFERLLLRDLLADLAAAGLAAAGLALADLDAPRGGVTIMRRTASVAAVTIAAPILLALSAAASAPSSASRPAFFALWRTF